MAEDKVTLQTSKVEVKVKLIRGLINDAKDHIFSAFYIKLDGTVREMVCRRHVTKGVKGTAKFDMEEVDRKHNQLTVYDMQTCGFRKINLDTVQELKVDGVRYVFTPSVKKATPEFSLMPLIKDFVENIIPSMEPDKEPTTVIHIHMGTNGTIKL